MPPTLAPKRRTRALRKHVRPLSRREVRVLHLLRIAKSRGLTDDKIDSLTGWGHQSTTPITCNLRRRGYITFLYSSNNDPVKRLTRHRRYAKVNVLTPKALRLLADPKGTV